MRSTRANGDFGALAQFVRALRRAGPSLTVLRTTIGAAQSVAVAIDTRRVARGRGHHLRRRHHFHRHRERARPGRARRPPAHPVPGLSMATPLLANGRHAHRARLLRRAGHLVPGAVAQPSTSGRPVITVTVDTGGIDAAAARTLAERARALGAVAHHQVDARADYFEQVLRFLIMGNVRRGAAVSAVRRRRARHAGADHRAHGARARHRHRSRTAAPRPATTRCASKSRCARWRRSSRCSRRCATRRSSARTSSTTCSSAACRCRRIGAAYSDQPRPVGRDHRRQGDARPPPAASPSSAWVLSTRRVHAIRARRERHTLDFEQGRPVGARRRALVAGGSSSRRSRRSAAPFGIGRGIHLGDTIIGTKGRVAFEAPAAEVLLTAHRELEKLVLTGAPAAHQGARWRSPTATWCTRASCSTRCAATSRRCSLSLAGARHRRGARAAAARQPVHRGRRLALLADGRLARACTARRPGEWTATDALGFSKIVALPGVFHARAGERARQQKDR